MFDTIFGLPMHPLVVHATSVTVPAAGLSVLLAAVWPRFRRWAGWLPLALAAASVVLVPLSTQTGEAFQRRVASSALLEEHAEMGDALIPWVLALFVGAAATYWYHRRELATTDEDGASVRGGRGGPSWLPIAAMVVAVVAGLGTTVEVALIGHSGAKAVWSDAGQKTPSGGGDE